jgi:hypothetical protein
MLTFDVARWSNTIYFSLPTELADLSASLYDKAVVLPPNNTTYPLSYTPAVYLRGRLLLHPFLFRKNSPLYSQIESTLKLEDRFTPDAEESLNVLKNLFRWVFDAQEIYDEGLLGYMWEHLTDPALGSPLVLTQAVERLEYLYYLGTRPVSRLTDSGGKLLTKGVRAKHFNDFDRFIIWYATTHDVPRLPYTLTCKDYTRLLAERWLWWHTPRTIGKNLKYESYKYDRPADHREFWRGTVPEAIEKLEEINPDAVWLV